MSDRQQFGRSCSLSVGARGSRGVLIYDANRITFDVSKDDGTSPNTARIEVYNLARSTASALAALPGNTAAILTCGYGVNPHKIISDQDVTFVSTRRTGTDLVTVIECGDGIAAAAQATINVSMPEGTKPEEVFKKLQAELATKGISSSSDFVEKLKQIWLDQDAKGQKKATSASFREKLEQTYKAFETGLTLHGNVKKLIDQHAKNMGVDVSVQDNTLVVADPNSYLGTEAVVVSPQTGLIGSPEVQSAASEVKGTFLVRFRTLLNPDLKIYHCVRLYSERFWGDLLKVVRLRHYGDTHGTDWYSEVEARSFLYPPGSLGQASGTVA